MTDSVSCPTCGGKNVSKLFSVFGIAKTGMRLGELIPAERQRVEALIERTSKRKCCKTVREPQIKRVPALGAECKPVLPNSKLFAHGRTFCLTG